MAGFRNRIHVFRQLLDGEPQVLVYRLGQRYYIAQRVRCLLQACVREGIMASNSSKSSKSNTSLFLSSEEEIIIYVEGPMRESGCCVRTCVEAPRHKNCLGKIELIKYI